MYLPFFSGTPDWQSLPEELFDEEESARLCMLSLFCSESELKGLPTRESSSAGKSFVNLLFVGGYSFLPLTGGGSTR